MKSVHCAVRTGSLNKAVCASTLKSFPFGLELDTQIAANHLWKCEYFTNQKRQRYEKHDIL